MTEAHRVLVVDDDPQLRKVLLGLLGKIGVETLEAEDGAEALDRVAAEPVGLVLLDLDMPRLNGLGFLARLRELPGGAKPAVIVVTAATDSTSRREAIKLGAIDYVEKPFRLPDLSRRVQRALTISELERRLEDAEDRLRTLRTVDPVTGVGATGALFRVLEAEFNAARVGERPLSCVVVTDESYGRLLDQGDRAAAEARLKRLVAGIESRLRGADRVFRVDAAEFVVLLPGAGRAGAARVVEKIEATAGAQTDLDDKDLVIAAATYPHPEISQASLLYRAVNLTLAEARNGPGARYFEGF